MNKVGIDLVAYETQIDHMTWSEAKVAIDATRSMDDVRAIFYGEQWGKLKEVFYADEYDSDVYYQILPSLWASFFLEEDAPVWSLGYSDRRHQIGVDFAIVAQVIKQIAKHILDEVYDVETDGE